MSNVANLMNLARDAEVNGDKRKALELYEKLVAHFPESRAAEEARGYIENLKSAISAQAEPLPAMGTGRGVAAPRAMNEGEMTLFHINAPFVTMVTYLVKLSFAMIPASIVVGVFWIVFYGVLFSIFR